MIVTHDNPWIYANMDSMSDFFADDGAHAPPNHKQFGFVYMVRMLAILGCSFINCVDEDKLRAKEEERERAREQKKAAKKTR